MNQKDRQAFANRLAGAGVLGAEVRSDLESLKAVDRYEVVTELASMSFTARRVDSDGQAFLEALPYFLREDCFKGQKLRLVAERLTALIRAARRMAPESGEGAVLLAMLRLAASVSVESKSQYLDAEHVVAAARNFRPSLRALTGLPRIHIMGFGELALWGRVASIAASGDVEPQDAASLSEAIKAIFADRGSASNVVPVELRTLQRSLGRDTSSTAPTASVAAGLPNDSAALPNEGEPVPIHGEATPEPDLRPTIVGEPPTSQRPFGQAGSSTGPASLAAGSANDGGVSPEEGAPAPIRVEAPSEPAIPPPTVVELPKPVGGSSGDLLTLLERAIEAAKFEMRRSGAAARALSVETEGLKEKIKSTLSSLEEERSKRRSVENKVSTLQRDVESRQAEVDRTRKEAEDTLGKLALAEREIKHLSEMKTQMASVAEGSKVAALKVLQKSFRDEAGPPLNDLADYVRQTVAQKLSDLGRLERSFERFSKIVNRLMLPESENTGKSS